MYIRRLLTVDLAGDYECSVDISAPNPGGGRIVEDNILGPVV